MKSFVLGLALLAGAGAPSKARELNDQGYDAYKDGDWEKAADLFHQAIDAGGPDAKALAMAHYNLACTLARAREDGKTCDLGADLDTIAGEVQAAINGDAGRRARAKVDHDLDDVHRTVGWLEGVEGLSPADDLGKIVTAIAWKGPAVGVAGSVSDLSLGKDGHAKLVFHAGGGRALQGSWSVKGDAVELDVSDGKRSLHGEGRLQGSSLVFEGELGSFFDDPGDDCGA